MTGFVSIDPREASRVLEQIAELLELQGADPFRVRAFRGASRRVRTMEGTLADAASAGRLASMRGIGPATAGVLEDLASTGSSQLHRSLRASVPPGLLEMRRIGGLGVARIRKIHQTLGIDTLSELEEAALDGRLERLPRFGARLAANVVSAIRHLRATAGERLLHHADLEAAALRDALLSLDGVLDVAVAGDTRRRKDLVRQLNLVVSTELPPAIFLERLRELKGVDEISGHDERMATLRFEGGRTADLIVTLPPNAGAVLVHATGSDQHVAALRARAAARGMSLTGGALWEGSRFIPTPSEASLYASLDMAWVPPELREDEPAWTTRPDTLVEQRDLRGLLHCHTHASDGAMSLAELATECAHLGYEYVGVTDHSGAAAYAGGLQADDLEAQLDAIDAYNADRPAVRVLKGVEADILHDGSLEYSPALLGRLDFVIASIHNRYGMAGDRMTERILTALRNPAVSVLGHPTGRLLQQRPPFDVDMDAVMEEAAQRGVALEINADPHRLDLNWEMARSAARRGVMLAIGADAHSIAGLGNVRYGIDVARKAGLTPAQILNSRSEKDFLRWVA